MFFFTKTPNLTSEIYEYTLDNINHKLTTYKSSSLSIMPKKVILFISGSYELLFDDYVKRTIYDLQQLNIDDEYELVVFEKRDKPSIIMYEDIAHYINAHYDNKNLDELIIIGFSSGGVVASHIMNIITKSEKYKTCKKKIITYDTPYHIGNNVGDFENYSYFRLDYYFYNVVYKIYNKTYNYDDIKKHLSKNNTFMCWNCGATELFQMVRDIHDWDIDMFNYVIGFNFDQDINTKIINIKCKNDPVVNPMLNDEYIKKNVDFIKMDITTIEKDVIGHTSDMAFNTKYIDDIIRSIRL